MSSLVDILNNEMNYLIDLSERPLDLVKIFKEVSHDLGEKLSIDSPK